MKQIETAKNQLRKILPQFFITSVSRIPVTITTNNIDGDEVLTKGETVSLSVYIVRKNRPWTFDKEGFIEGGDAQMLVKHDDIINRHDYIIWNNNTYRVETVLDRDQLGGEIAYKTCNLFLI